MPLCCFSRTPGSYVFILVTSSSPLNHFTVLPPVSADPAAFAPSTPTSLGSCSNSRRPMTSDEVSCPAGTLLSSYKYTCSGSDGYTGLFGWMELRVLSDT
ncbi:hypothetical protein C8R44DRAFT_879562 [Mycena epipterygia]|nr:hypothetical protein C8R44DRAFT_879562 [Mycena epipterygia]